jgi:hypothetical protein
MNLRDESDDLEIGHIMGEEDNGRTIPLAVPLS